MNATTPKSGRGQPAAFPTLDGALKIGTTARRWFAPLVMVFLCSAWVVTARAQQTDESPAVEPPGVDLIAPDGHGVPQGRLIRIGLPITGNADQRVRQTIQRALGDMSPDGPRVLVLELAPGATDAGRGSSVSRAMEIARDITQLGDVKTVAYVPRSIQGHAVLVAMACDEIVMKDDATIGNAGVDEPKDKPIGPTVRSSYDEIASQRRTIPLAVALGMLDAELEVLKVETDVSVEYVLRQDLDKLKENRSVESVETLIPAGEMGDFSGREAREMRFVKYLAKDRASLARGLGLPADALADDPSLGSDWKPIQVYVDGTIDGLTASSLRKMIQKQLAEGQVNFVLVRIDSSGGSLGDSLRLANFLAGLDPSQVRTVAYVPREAGGEAALIALACQQLVMTPEAKLGGEAHQRLDAETSANVRDAIREWPAVVEHRRTWSLPAATLDGQLPVYRYVHRKSGEVQFFSEEELAEQDVPGDWQRGELVTAVDTPLAVDGRRASQIGLAWETVDSFDQLKQHYGLETDPRLVQPGWADMLVEVLASPGMAALLLFIGFAALYAELQLPGIGIGGFIAGVAFLLFFWSKFTVQTADWLEVILFLGGVCFLLLEIFVLPGFGIFGLGGGLMIIASLVLASQTFILPHTAAEMGDLRRSVTVVCAAAMGMIGAAVVMRRYLPNAPVFNRIMLNPLDEEELAAQQERETVVDFQHMLGCEGVTTTPLSPSGKAKVGDELLDVVSDGDAIERGAAIVVVEVHGNRVVVKARDAGKDV